MPPYASYDDAAAEIRYVVMILLFTDILHHRHHSRRRQHSPPRCARVARARQRAATVTVTYALIFRFTDFFFIYATYG